RDRRPTVIAKATVTRKRKTLRQAATLTTREAGAALSSFVSHAVAFAISVGRRSRFLITVAFAITAARRRLQALCSLCPLWFFSSRCLRHGLAYVPLRPWLALAIASAFFLFLCPLWFFDPLPSPWPRMQLPLRHGSPLPRVLVVPFRVHRPCSPYARVRL